MKEMKKDRVVVVGGGIAGALVAKLVQEFAYVTLIDPKEYFEIPWANLRAKVDPSVAARSIIHHTDYLTEGSILTAFALDVTQSEVLTSAGRVVKYDYLVVATGHVNANPVRRLDRIEMFHQENEKIRSAESILIIGGGPVGVELAAEISIDFPAKSLTLVHSGARLLEFIGPRAAAKALAWLKGRGVRVLLGQSVDVGAIREGERVYGTSMGERVVADVYFDCTGKQVGSQWLEDSILRDYIDFNGRLMVDENLRVGGLKNIFAIGDITDIQESKQGYAAQKHASVVAKNLKLLIKSTPNPSPSPNPNYQNPNPNNPNNPNNSAKLHKYRPATSASAMVTLGRREAVAELPFLPAVVGLIPGLVKSRDMFVGRTRKLMGLDGYHKIQE